MDITFNKRRRHHGILSRPELSQNLYFYTQPPIQNIKLKTFEDYANDRMKILKVVEKLGKMHLKSSVEYTEAMRLELNNVTNQGSLKNMLRKSDHLETSNLREIDNTSHFILRLAYCKTSELRKWFADQETDLFRYRFMQLSRQQVDQFFKANDLVYEPIPADTKQTLRESLINSSYSVNNDNFNDISFYKTPFLEVLDLVKNHQVYIKGGMAYVLHSQLFHSVANVFKARLIKDLELLSYNIENIADEFRFDDIFSAVTSSTANNDSEHQTGSGREIKASMVDELSRHNFPLCMSEMHRSLRSKHHMRHFGRLQLGLFLKAIGLSLDESQEYWKSEFTKLMDVDKFYKQYSYGIRYNYGKEGRKVNVRPFSCSKIITMNDPGPSDCHGCPFKHYDLKSLQQALKERGMSRDQAVEIADLAKQGHQQVACGMLFQATHPKYQGQKYVSIHPNQYFDDSLKVEAGSSIYGDQVVKEVSSSSVGKKRRAEEEEDDVDDSLLAQICMEK